MVASSLRPRIWLAVAVASALVASVFAQAVKVPGQAAVPLVNSGFELALPDNAARPAGWFKAGPGETYSRDARVFRSGSASLSLQRSEGAAFTAVAQTVPATALQNSVVVLRAWVRGDGADSAGALALMALGGDRKSVGYAQSEAPAGTESGDWLLHETRLLVPPTAQHLQAGLRLTAGGTRWFDDVELITWPVDASNQALLSPVAEKYLGEALDAVRGQALHSGRVDWSTVVAQARALAAGAAAPSDTYDAIRHVLRAFHDGHSHLQTPTARATAERSVSKSVTAVSITTVRGRPLLVLPGFASMDEAAEQAFAMNIQRAIAAAGRPECGLLLDLRTNAGGNMFPMLAGLAPLFGDGEVGGLLTSTGAQVAWKFERGRFVSSGPGQTTKVIDLPERVVRLGAGTTPVAVLLGPTTASSGEAVAIAFVGRPQSRSFGSNSAGRTTGNRPVVLPDGALLAITSATMRDRTGTAYGGVIRPDEVVAPAKAASPEDDAVPAAAVTWLDSQKACAN